MRDFIAEYGDKPAQTVGSPGYRLTNIVAQANKRGVFHTAQLNELNILMTTFANWI